MCQEVLWCLKKVGMGWCSLNELMVNGRINLMLRMPAYVLVTWMVMKKSFNA